MENFNLKSDFFIKLVNPELHQNIYFIYLLFDIRKYINGFIYLITIINKFKLNHFLQMHCSTRFEKQNCNLPHIEINEILCLVCDIGAEISIFILILYINIY